VVDPQEGVIRAEATVHGIPQAATEQALGEEDCAHDARSVDVQLLVLDGVGDRSSDVLRLDVFSALRREIPGALFTRIWRNTVSLEPLSGHVPACCGRARKPRGLDGTRITAHSMRAGHATAAALAGVPLDRIAAQTRHKDLSVLVNRYIRPLEALATTSSRHLGL